MRSSKVVISFHAVILPLSTGSWIPHNYLRKYSLWYFMPFIGKTIARRLRELSTGVILVVGWVGCRLLSLCRKIRYVTFIVPSKTLLWFSIVYFTSLLHQVLQFARGWGIRRSGEGRWGQWINGGSIHRVLSQLRMLFLLFIITRWTMCMAEIHIFVRGEKKKTSYIFQPLLVCYSTVSAWHKK